MGIVGTPNADRICFVIAPIGEPESETRKRSDQVLKHIIEPAVAGRYEAIRADKISAPGLITAQVIQHVVEAPLVIADLTDYNPNVFYELAIRHAFRRPYIQLILEGQKVPFDVAPLRTIFYDPHNLDSAAEAKKEIVAQIDTLEEPHAAVENPISVAVDLQNLRQSGDPQQKGLADVLAALTDLRRDMAQSQQIERLQEVVEYWGEVNRYGILTFPPFPHGATTPADAEHLGAGKSPYAILRPMFVSADAAGEIPRPPNVSRATKTSRVTDQTPGTPPGIPGSRSESS